MVSSFAPRLAGKDAINWRPIVARASEPGRVCCATGTSGVAAMAVTPSSLKCFYNQHIATFLSWESTMGHTLHNRIYLGRRALGRHTAAMAALAMLGAVAGIGLLWMLARLPK
jgi:hypothetical protein